MGWEIYWIWALAWFFVFLGKKPASNINGCQQTDGQIWKKSGMAILPITSCFKNKVKVKWGGVGKGGR